MNWIKRLNNLWSWSALPAPKDAFFKDEEGVALIKRSSASILRPPEKAKVIPYKKRDPVQEIVNQIPE